MRLICVILCLIISTSVPAYAGSMLWATKHSSTNLAKDEEWLLSATTEAGKDVEEAIEDIDGDTEDPEADPEADPEDSVEYIDPTLVMEETEATPLETLMDSTTLDEIQEDSVEYAAPEESMDEGVEEIIAPIDKTGENQSS